MEPVTTTLIPCAFCRGRGVDPCAPLSAWGRCEVCRGRGENEVPVPHTACRYCQGSGSYRTFSCLVCRGTGVVPPVPGPAERCPDCRGRAFDAAGGLPCLRCRGRGLVTSLAGAGASHRAVLALEPTRAEAAAFETATR
jgi:DnaJ-class molecular chaperone